MKGKVCTPFGFKLIGELRVGDQISNPDGTVARVIQIHELGSNPDAYGGLYEVETVDGAVTIVTGDHLWVRRLSGGNLKADRRMLTPDGEWEADKTKLQVVTTEQLAEEVARCYADIERGQKPHWPLIPLTQPVKFTVTSRNAAARWPIEPYVLGVLLGDGTFRKGGIEFYTADPEMVERFGMEDVRKGGKKGKAHAYHVNGERGKRYRDALKKWGLWGVKSEGKFVPDEYKVTPLEMRWALLQGLMDTDGYIDGRGHTHFASVSKRLAEDVQWLAWSLGFKATIYEKETGYRNQEGERIECLTAYEVYISGDNRQELFHLPRKRRRARKGINGGDEAMRRIVAVRKVSPQAPVQARCIAVDHPNSLYVTDDFIVTHNSESLLMAALQYAEVPGYAALLLRRTYSDLALPGALMDRAYEWLGPTAAHWSESTKTWTFPSGATLTFGYLETDKHKYRYQGSEFQFIGFDELTQFPEPSYTYLFSRLRRTRDIPVPLRMRAGSNPGGEGHQWVYERFIVPHAKKDRLFIPAGLRDNPHIDVKGYIESLAELDDVTRAQLLDGLWITDPARKAFLADWWRRKNRYHTDDFRVNKNVVGRWISWDTGLKDKETSAYSACVVLELLNDYRVRVREVWRDKLQFPDLPDAIERKAAQWNQDGLLRSVVIEDKASGTSAYQTLMRTAPEWLSSILINFEPTGDKEQRAKQAAVWCKRDMVLLPFPGEDMSWLSDFESELYSFPDCIFKDQVDAFSQSILWGENLLAVGWRGRQERGAEE